MQSDSPNPMESTMSEREKALEAALIDAHAKLANILNDPVAAKGIGGMFAGTQRAEETARAALALLRTRPFI